MKKFTPKPAKPNTEASMCEYMACHGIRPCTINPLKEICTLATMGKVNENCTTFTPVKELNNGVYVSKWRCPKLDDHKEVVERAKHKYTNRRHLDRTPINLPQKSTPNIKRNPKPTSDNTKTWTGLISAILFFLAVIVVIARR